MSSAMSRAARAAGWTAGALVALAGCAGHDGPRSVTGTNGAAPAAASGAPAYAVVDGKHEAVPAIAMGDPATVARILDEGKNRNRVMDHLAYLSNTIGPRLTGSTNAETANKWGRDQFASWGLSTPPFGGFEGQTSSDPSLRGLWQWGTVATRFDRGPSAGKILSVRNPGSQSPEYQTVRAVDFTALAWTIGTDGPVRGPVVRMPETDEQFEAAKGSIAGAWVLVRPSQPGRRGVISGASARTQLYTDIRKKWTTGEQLPQRGPAVDKDATRFEGTLTGGFAPDGAPFTLDVNLTNPAAVKGSISMGGFRVSELVDATFNPQTRELKFRTESARGNRDYALTIDGDTLKGQTVLPDNGGTIAYSAKKVAVEDAASSGPLMEERVLALKPAGWIVASTNELVITGGAPGWTQIDPAALNPDVIVTVRQSDYECMNSRIADGVPVFAEFDLKHSFQKGPIPVYDTIAEIRGTERPDEVVIVSGHLDSWNGPGSQGTTDNGTGSAVTLEAARLLMAAHAKPKRTIRFILWTGEEQGLLGSAAYVKYLKEKGELEKVSAVLVDDGGTNYEGGLGCVASQVPYLAAATAPVNGQFYSETDRKALDVNIRTQKQFTQVQGSDHNSFVREKIPGFFWDEEGRADYNYTHHTQHDRLDQAIPEYLKQSATCAAVTAYNLANAPDLLARPTEDEWPRRGGGARTRGSAGQPLAPTTGAAPGAGSGNN